MKTVEEIKQFLKEQEEHPIEIEPASKYQQWFCLALRWVLEDNEDVENNKF